MPGWRIRRFMEFLGEPFLNVGGMRLSLMTVIGLTLSLVVTLLVARAVRRTLMRVLQRAQVGLDAQHTISRLAQYAVVSLGVLISLDNIGFQMQSVMAAGALVSVGLGFGLQSLTQSLVNGLIILVERPFKVGDIIEVDGVVCRVETIHNRTSRLIDQDGILRVVPNSDFVNKAVVNYTAVAGRRRFPLPIVVGLESDPQVVARVIQAAVEAHPDVLKEPAVVVQFTAHLSHAQQYVAQFWIEEIWYAPRILSELRFRVHGALEAAGIRIPVLAHEVRILDRRPGGPNPGEIHA